MTKKLNPGSYPLQLNKVPPIFKSANWKGAQPSDEAKKQEIDYEDARQTVIDNWGLYCPRRLDACLDLLIDYADKGISHSSL